jgi:saccharopine dehydrogenase (NAD+, L-lysine forming)
MRFVGYEIYLCAKLGIMLRIGIIKERKVPPDERTPFTPAQCAHIQKSNPNVHFVVEPSDVRSYKDEEYSTEGIEMSSDLSSCDILMGIKEASIDYLMPGKTYVFFSHTKKQQPHNKKLMHALIAKNIRMVDYECLTHADEQRIIGFGYFAGIVGAHNGIKAYCAKHGLFELPAAHQVKNYEELVAAYEHHKLPNFKIVLTGSGRVALGVLDLMNKLDIEPVEPFDFLVHQYDYPVFTHLKGADLYARKDSDKFFRDDFHANPEAYKCLFSSYIPQTDILMNGIYWDHKIARLFDKEDIRRLDWRPSVVADITCDIDGSVPINFGSSTIADPVYGVERSTFKKVAAAQNTTDIIDVMAVDNLPNELPRDASHYFGVHLEKYVLPEMLQQNSKLLYRATICENGKLTPRFEYLSEYAYN